MPSDAFAELSWVLVSIDLKLSERENMIFVESCSYTSWLNQRSHLMNSRCSLYVFHCINLFHDEINVFCNFKFSCDS